MARYEYRCPSCGPFETAHPIGVAPAEATCPDCEQTGRRVFSPPLLAATSPRLSRLLTHEERSREAPEVVTTVPPAPPRSPARPSHRLHAELPRP